MPASKFLTQLWEKSHWLVMTLLVSQVLAWLNFFLFASQRSSFTASSDPVTIFAIGLAIVSAIRVGRGHGGLGLTMLLLANAFSLLLSTFAEWYWSIGSASSGNFAGADGGLSKIDAFYFALGTLTTAGAGSIAAVSEASKTAVAVQMLLDFVLTGFALAVAATRLSERARNSPAVSCEDIHRESISMVREVTSLAAAAMNRQADAAADTTKPSEVTGAGKSHDADAPVASG